LSQERHIIVIAALCAALSGCAVARSPYTHSYADEANQDVALAYGFVDMSEAPAPLARVKVKRLQGARENPYVYFGETGGVFYHEALAPGAYQFAALEGVPGKLHLGPLTMFPRPPYALSMPAKQAAFKVAPARLYYLGSYKCLRDRSGIVSSYTVESAEEPGEAEILRRLSHVVQDTKWERLVAKRLRELGE
jgi:hypothetical protein